jgi:hypothetical protein
VISADRNKEARGNLCAISISNELVQKVSTQELVAFLNDVMTSRTRQLSVMLNAVDMTFYVWLDEQASQLRWSLVSGYGEPLQFGAANDDLASLEQIAQSFLDFGYHDGTPMSEFTMSGPGEESNEEEVVRPPFPVFIRCLHYCAVP